MVNHDFRMGRVGSLNSFDCRQEQGPLYILALKSRCPTQADAPADQGYSGQSSLHELGPDLLVINRCA